MPLKSITTDPESLTLTAIGDYPVPVSRLWAAFADPRQLERFWGPPEWPATFTRHEMEVGGRSEYYMSGPNGEISRGYWRFHQVHEGSLFEVSDGFMNEDGTPNTDMASLRMTVRFEETADGSRFVATSRFPSVEAMEQLAAMGMEEGYRTALAQMDDVLAGLRASIDAASLEILDECRVRVVRDVRGSLEQVWRAHNEAALLQQWLLGPPGWTMPVCEVATEVGDSFRYEWEREEGSDRIVFVGELLESEPPRRVVTTERMVGMPGPGTRNELLFIPRPGRRVRIETTITYPSQEVRDIVLGRGIVDGMEASYTRLDALIEAAA